MAPARYGRFVINNAHGGFTILNIFRASKTILIEFIKRLRSELVFLVHREELILTLLLDCI